MAQRIEDPSFLPPNPCVSYKQGSIHPSTHSHIYQALWGLKSLWNVSILSGSQRKQLVCNQSPMRFPAVWFLPCEVREVGFFQLKDSRGTIHTEKTVRWGDTRGFWGHMDELLWVIPTYRRSMNIRSPGVQGLAWHIYCISDVEKNSQPNSGVRGQLAFWVTVTLIQKVLDFVPFQVSDVWIRDAGPSWLSTVVVNSMVKAAWGRMG